MLPIERLRHILAARTARVRLFGFNAFRQSEFAQLLAETGHHITFDDINLDPAAGTDVIIWNTQLRTTLARGVDTSALFEDIQRIAGLLQPGQLFLVTGVVPPGTTRRLVLPRLVIAGLRPGHDFLVAYTPSLDTGKPCVLAGLDPTSQAAANSFLTSFTLTVVPVTTLETAELCGLIPQVYRTVQLAVGNDLRMLGDRIGASFWEAIAAVGLPELAPIVGGSDVATAFLTWGARRFDTTSRLCELASEVNTTVPAFLVTKIEDALNARARPLRGSRILLLGGLPAPTDPNTRISIPDELRATLQKKGARLTVCDPDPMRLTDSTALTVERLASQDVVVILEDHAGCDYEFLVTHSRLVLDTQHVTRNVTHGREKIVTV